MDKICTSLEQSQKLIELGIDANTADMVYLRVYIGEERDYILLIDSYPEEYTEKGDGSLIPVYDEHIPAWSLTALLELIPNWQMQTQDNGIGILYGCKEEIKIIEGETPLDAAFEIVCWLKENKKL